MPRPGGARLTKGYSNEKEYSDAVASTVQARTREIRDALEREFSGRISSTQASVVDLGGMSAEDLGALISRNGQILKPLLVVAGVATRAIERDLGIRNLKPYKPALSKENAVRIAEYVLALLPERIMIETLVEVDRVDFLSSQKRAWKGAWEKRISESVSAATGRPFKKRMLTAHDELFEVDAAYPPVGDIQYAVDIKRCEARRDFQKRSDEIVNKARVFKVRYPKGKFVSVVYYPFDEGDFRGRLGSGPIDLIVFGNDSDESIAEVGNRIAREFGLNPSSQ